MVVAIDGPAGAGKSTVARATARALGFTYLDSGAMYRAAALAAGERRRRLRPRRGARDRAGRPGDRQRRGRDRGDPHAGGLRGRVAVATNEKVRAALVEKQRALLAEGDWVAEGRDIGTVVAPDAAVKVFLTADPGERARRRAEELGTDVDDGPARPGAARRPGRGPRALAAAAAPATRSSSTPPASRSTRSWSASPTLVRAAERR